MQRPSKTQVISFFERINLLGTSGHPGQKLSIGTSFEPEPVTMNDTIHVPLNEAEYDAVIQWLIASPRLQ